MLYNKNLKKVPTNIDCLNCPFYDNLNKECLGFGRVCFEYDYKTETCIDPVTKLPIKFE